MTGTASIPELNSNTIDQLLQQQPESVRKIGLALQALLNELQADAGPKVELAQLRFSPEQKAHFKQLVAQFRALPFTQQNAFPNLIQWIALIELGLGEFQAAERDFHQLAELTPALEQKADAHFQAYLAALERPHLGDAFKELKHAYTNHPERCAPIPLDQFEPDRILLHDAFGVTFRCIAKKAQRVVQIRRLDDRLLDRGLAAIWHDLKQLAEVKHEGIAEILSLGFLDPECQKPYIVSAYDDWLSLEAYVQRYGPLQPRDVQQIALKSAEALATAHQHNILHRAVCPSFITIQKSPTGWQAQLAHFGMAIQKDELQASTKNPAQLMRTAQGRWIAHWLDYAAPEQHGQAAGAVSNASDIFAWAKTMCFALFGTPHPAAQHWQKIKPEWAELLNSCLAPNPHNRPSSFAAIIQLLQSWQASQANAGPIPSAPPPGVAPMTTPKLSSGMPIRRRLTPIEELKLRIRQLTIFYGLIALGITALVALCYFVFFYQPATVHPQIVKVKGRVMLEGKGVAKAKIIFKNDNPELPDATAVADDDGYYVLTTLLPSDGAYVGRYRVLITKDNPDKARVIPALPSGDPNNPTYRPNPFAGFEEVHPNYGQINTTPLRGINIPEEGHNNLILQLNLLGR